MEMPNRMCEHFLSPSETARRLGVGVRALRLYERRGLVCPGRTHAGWRVYGPNEIERLHQVLTLKSLGLSLARITQLLGGRVTAWLRRREGLERELRSSDPLPFGGTHASTGYIRANGSTRVVAVPWLRRRTHTA